MIKFYCRCRRRRRRQVIALLCAPILVITFYLTSHRVFLFSFFFGFVSFCPFLCSAACNFTPSAIKRQFLRLSQMTFMFPNGYILYQIEIAQTSTFLAVVGRRRRLPGCLHLLRILLFGLL